jgi:acetyl-CoA carboxylase biotin carboxyl carrier protein
LDLNDESIRALFQLIDELDFTEFTLESGDTRIVIRRGDPARSDSEAPSHQGMDELAARRAAEVQVPAEAPAPAPPPTPTLDTDAEPPDTTEVRAPMLGTFYRAPKPGEPPFVAVGDRVETGMVVGIIEVMKLMNSVTAPFAGVVADVCADNGQLVEFEQVLFRVIPDVEAEAGADVPP